MVALPFLLRFVNGHPKKVARFAMSHRAIVPQQVEAELDAFAAVVAMRKPKSVLEIGTMFGGMLFFLCRLSDLPLRSSALFPR